jgi:hypothetical protein
MRFKGGSVQKRVRSFDIRFDFLEAERIKAESRTIESKSEENGGCANVTGEGAFESLLGPIMERARRYACNFAKSKP